jgi:nucleoside-diphosphate-sugar epimerase/uncharacterized membrane protein
MGAALAGAPRVRMPEAHPPCRCRTGAWLAPALPAGPDRNPHAAMPDHDRPLIVITGAAGGIGRALTAALVDDHRVVGIDREGSRGDIPMLACDFGDDASVAACLDALAAQHGRRIASVIHLAAYFDFTGEDNPLYASVNVEGTRRLLRGLQAFEVEQFVHASTMLVHAPCAVGERIDEDGALEPKWAYPRSKAEAEAVVRAERGAIPAVLLRLAGVYDRQRMVPTLAQQIARIHQRDLQSHLYSGDPAVGQAFLHQDDMLDAFVRTVERRGALPAEVAILIGEPDTPGYGALQDAIGRHLHGAEGWTTLQLPKPVARAGAALQGAIEPLVPDALDQGEAPFVKPFMVTLADDHYALDIGRARTLLGWRPRHRLLRELPAMLAALQRDPLAWYQANGVTPPAWMTDADAAGRDPAALAQADEQRRRALHARHLWAPWLNVMLGAWLATSPWTLKLQFTPMLVSDIASGLALVVLGACALSWRAAWARYGAALVGLWLLTAPLLFWAPSAAGYLNDTLCGVLAIGFALLTPPEPGVSPLAAIDGPEAPPGWSYNPSAWPQRLPIIALALIGLQVSRQLAAYQLGHVDGVWEPFFAGGPDPKNGTEEIITSSVSEAWPVPDAGLGALTYALEIVTGIAGSQKRWRTMPWLVLLFGLMIVPLGFVSIFFIVIQPIWIGTWCTLCLLGAAAMVVQIPYSLDELVATLQFLRRRHRAGQPWLRVLLRGDTDAADADLPEELKALRPELNARAFERPPLVVLKDMWGGGVNLPWNLALAIALGVWLMLTRLTLDAPEAAANAHHLIGALVITFAITACAEVARTLRFVVSLLGAALVVVALVQGGSVLVWTAACGAALVLLGLPRGRVAQRYGRWTRAIL